MGALIDAFPQALALVFDPYTVGVALVATVFGLFVGAMPGLTATMAVALLIRVTFFIPPVPALVAIVMSTPVAILPATFPARCCAFWAHPLVRRMPMTRTCSPSRARANWRWGFAW